MSKDKDMVKVNDLVWKERVKYISGIVNIAKRYNLDVPACQWILDEASNSFKLHAAVLVYGSKMKGGKNG